MDGVLQLQPLRKGSKEKGAPTSGGEGGTRGICLQLGSWEGRVPARRPGAGAERKLQTRARQKHPVLGQGPRASTDSKAKVRSEPWGGPGGHADG